MIRTIADLLETLMRREAQLLAAEEITHPGIIGEMYEGLSKKLIAKALPIDADLMVTSGVIVNSKGDQSRQIDCMVVSGVPTPIPHTTHHKCNDRDVVAVVEVKKSLYSDGVRASYTNLSSVFDVCQPYEVEDRLLADAYKGITRTLLPAPEEVEYLPQHLQMIYHSLVVESTKPLRIVLGYDGFRSEFALREAYIELLNKNVLKSGFSPVRFPNLMVSGEYSLVKANGMPYSMPLKDDMWMCYVSTKTNPLLLLLELLFTRLTYMMNISMAVFGEDLERVAFQPLLGAIYGAKPNGVMGWEYNSIEVPKEVLRESPSSMEWMPFEVNEVQFVILNQLCRHGSISLEEQSFLEYLEENHYQVDTLISELMEMGLATSDGGRLELLTDQCDVVAMPDGKMYAAENNSGRLTRWVSRQTNV